MTMRTPHHDANMARDYLLNEYGVAEGSTIYVVQRHVSRSGMMRYLSLFVAADDKVYGITHLAASVLGMMLETERIALRVEGAGMDMHFHIVYRLASALFDDGYALNHRTL